MSVIIRLNKVFQDATADRDTVEVSGRTVGECLKQLAQRYPGLRDMLFDDRGRLAALVVLHQETLLPGQLDLPVTDADELLILPLIYGG